MPVSDLHRHVASVALRAASRHGFALGGGNALIAHGVIDRVTQDVDLFTDDEHGVKAAAGAVEAALRAAGFRADREDMSGLADVFEGMGEGLAEWTITGPDGQQMMLQMAYFGRASQPVIMEFGPVLGLEDVIAGKVCALASRAVPRDYLDTAAAMDHYTVAELIGLARRLDPGLTDEDFADAGRRLDRVGDGWFASLGLAPADVAALRKRFLAWPRASAGPRP
jgi:Nucleotidyl transferase AbiEii toxin, Type IV TA system